jgi:hypothetical protein
MHMSPFPAYHTLQKQLLDWDNPDRLAKTVDRLVLLALSLLAMSISAWGLSQLDERLYRLGGIDVYFHADTHRVLDVMTFFGAAARDRDSVHPLFSLLSYPIAKALILLGLTPVIAAKTLIGLAAGASAALFYRALRHLTLPIYAAALFTAAFIFSATFVYWFAVVETYAFAAVSICWMLAILARVQATPAIVWILASAFTLSVTVTNWMLALAAAFFRLSFLRSLAMSAAALALVIALALVQVAVFPTSKLFFSTTAIAFEWRYTQIAQEEIGKDPWKPADNLQSFLIYGAVSPGHKPALGPAQGITNVGLPLWEVLKAHGLPIALWLSLLIAGTWGIVSNSKLWPVGAALGAFIAGQAALHSVYGEVTFLYAAHFFPALLCVAACAYFAPARRLWLAVAVLLLVIGGAANIQQFKAAAADANAILRR